jgi:hypothetical protein
LHPPRAVQEPAGEQADIKDQAAILCFPSCQEVGEQRGEPGILQYMSHCVVSRAEAAAPAAVCEEHCALRLLGHSQNGGESHRSRLNLDIPFGCS